MNPTIEKLSKFLKLEAERGYDNRAVMGGLQRMLEPWRAEAEANNIPAEIIQVVITRLRDYPNLSPGSREEVLKGLWNRLKTHYPELEGRESAPGEAPEPVAVKDASPPAEPQDPPSTDEPLQAEPPSQAQDAVVGEKPESVPEKESPSVEKPAPPIALQAPLTTLPGVGSKTAKTLEKLDLRTLGDLLWHLPRRYDDYSQLKTISRLWYGEEVTVIGTVEEINVRSVRGGRMKLVEATIADGTGALRITWFNQPWIAKRLTPGKAVVLSGKVDQYLGRLTMSNPEWEPLERQQLHTNRIVPVYPLTAGVSGKWLRRVIHSVVNRYAHRTPDPLPESVRSSAAVISLPQALAQIHFPNDWDTLEEAQHRLAFDEMFLLQLGVLRQKSEWESLVTEPLTIEDQDLERFVESLPFTLTQAQQRSVESIRADLATSRPMNRLLQGDVGSGKTAVAAAAIVIAAANGAQSAVMAPTSILAEQHYATLSQLLPKESNIHHSGIRLLLGSTSEAEKENIRHELAQGNIQVLIGTHALLEDPVAFKRLGLVIVDEQHRFGVNQRAILRAKGDNPNLLVMTATPIPRSLALTIYGDLDLSVIDEMPPGRKPIETRVLTPLERNRAYTFIRNKLEKNQQAFIIYPLVEESDKIDAKAAVEEHKRLQKEVFPNHSIGLLHGRLKADEKEAVMNAFRNGEYDILVSTSVVEVGVDVPKATVILIEGANRFGLAQLHQFRGRVGRGEQESFCLLIPDSSEETENERLKAMEATQDGFILAEKDLDQRGPGEFLGTRQSGFAELQLAQLTDIRLIEKARQAAKQLFERDPALSQPQHKALAETLDRFWRGATGELS